MLSIVCLGQGATASEFRAFWIDTWGNGILSQSQVDNLLGVPGNASSLGQIRAANCNAVVIEVRRNCDACYPSSMGEPYMSGLSPSNFNALQAVINAAHDTTGGKKRIEVHCWMVTFRTSGGTVYARHDDTPTGSLTNLDNYWPSRDDAGAETSDYAFDPGHPLAEDYTVNVAMDIVSNFDVDGIHFDYIRFTANNQGYNPTSVARYNARYGLTGQPAATNSQWQQWRRDQVSAVVRKVYAKTQAIKPWVKVSGSFVTWNPSPTASTRAAFQGTRPYYDVYSDWDSWLQEGIVDAAMPMTYYDYASLPSDWTKWINFEKDRHGNRHMYIGPGIYLNSLSNSILELQQTRTASPSGNYAQGFCGYSYRVPYVGGDWAGFSPSLVSNVTPTWDDIPAMSWKTSPTKGHISGTVTIASTGKWADGATVSITGPESRSMYVDGTGFYAFVDLTPGTYTVTASLSGQPNAVRSVNVQVGSVTGNMYVTDLALGVVGPPVISGVASSGIGPVGATVTWTTDQNADSQVEYGLTATYGWSTPLDSTQTTTHSVPMTGLTPNTLYHYRVRSTNDNGTSYSGDYTLTTTSGVPVISNVTATSVTNNSATITWTTNIASDSKVNYGPTASYGSQKTDGTQVTAHSLTITGLSAKTTYHYQCVSTNGYGAGSSTDFTFTTSGAPVISNVGSGSVASTSAVVTWNTDVAANSTVNYGTTTSYGSQQTDSSSVTSHSVTLTGLTPQTTYHYQCVSTNPYGTATSTDYSFTTAAPPVEIVVDDSAAAYTGTWTSGTGAGYAGTYHYASNRRTSSNATATWRPSIISDGSYNVYCTYPAVSNATTNATFTVYYSGGSASTTLNQTTNTNTWNLIASNVPFVSGTSGYVTLPNNTGESSGTKNVVADAIKFVYVGVPSPPVISSVQATGLTGSGATITWSTDLASTSQVEYGTTSGYGSSTTIDSNAVTSHSVAISGLSPGVTYHYRVKSGNAGGTTASGDYTFSTPVEVIVDDADAGATYTGSWTAGTYSGGYNGTYKFCYSEPEIANASCTWTPDLPLAGTYNVYCWYTSGSNRTVAATYRTYHAAGVTTTTLNQTTAGQQWNLIASGVPFAAGSGGYVTMDNVTGEASGSKVLIGDAIRFVWTGGDSVAPTAPGSLLATAASTSSINLSWSPSTDTFGVAGYRIYRNSLLAGTSATTTCTDSGLTANTQYSYAVSAYDAAANESAKSGSVSRYTLSTPPTGSIITCDKPINGWSDSPSFVAANLGFGAGKVTAYRYAWDGSATHTWTDSEPSWTTTSRTLTADTTTHPFYFHVKGYNGDGVGNGTLDLGPYNYGIAYGSIAAATNNPDGSGVIISPNKSITAVLGSSFYVEESDRTRGIRIDAATALTVGKTVQIGGRLSGSTSERSLTDAAVMDSANGTALAPVLTRISALGGVSPNAFTSGLPGASGAYNVGLLVRVVGAVKSHATGSFVIDDGSGATAKVYSDKVVSDQSFVGVTGISAIEGGQRVIRTRSQADVVQYAP